MWIGILFTSEVSHGKMYRTLYLRTYAILLASFTDEGDSSERDDHCRKLKKFSKVQAPLLPPERYTIQG